MIFLFFHERYKTCILLCPNKNTLPFGRILKKSLIKWLSLPEYATYTSHFLTTLNGSINVFIYFCKHKKDFMRSCVGILTIPSAHSSPKNINQTEIVS
jgi:hypothetical protein